MLIAILVVFVVALLLFAARGGSAFGLPFRGEGLTIWPVKWEARDN